MTVLRSVYVGVLVSALALVLSATPSAARTDARLEEAAALESRALSLVRDGKPAPADTLYQRALELRAAKPPREDDAIPLAGLADLQAHARAERVLGQLAVEAVVVDHDHARSRPAPSPLPSCLR